jgi:protein-tyrosine-phosphatase
MPDDLLLKALADQGCDGSGIGPAQQLTDKLVRRSRLIITAARMHRAFVVSLDKKAAHRTYTLKELAHLLDPSPGGLGVDGVLAQAALRAATVSAAGIDEDLADPYGQLWPAYQRMAGDVAAAMDVLVPALRS